MRISPKELDEFPRFSCVEDGIYVVDSLCFFTGNNLSILCDLLNSEYGIYYFFRNVATLDNGGFQMRQQYIENIPVPKQILQNKLFSIDSLYQCFHFSDMEISFIKGYIYEYKIRILSNG